MIFLARISSMHGNFIRPSDLALGGVLHRSDSVFDALSCDGLNGTGCGDDSLSSSDSAEDSEDEQLSPEL